MTSLEEGPSVHSLVELITWEALISEQCFLPQEICQTTTVSAARCYPTNYLENLPDE